MTLDHGLRDYRQHQPRRNGMCENENGWTQQTTHNVDSRAAPNEVSKPARIALQRKKSKEAARYACICKSVCAGACVGGKEKEREARRVEKLSTSWHSPRPPEACRCQPPRRTRKAVLHIEPHPVPKECNASSFSLSLSLSMYNVLPPQLA